MLKNLNWHLCERIFLDKYSIIGVLDQKRVSTSVLVLLENDYQQAELLLCQEDISRLLSRKDESSYSFWYEMFPKPAKKT